MSGPHEEATPSAAPPSRGDQPPLVESVPLFPADVPPVPPLPTAASAPLPPYRHTRAAAREVRMAEERDDRFPEDTVPRPAAPTSAPADPPRATPAPAQPAAAQPRATVDPNSPFAKLLELRSLLEGQANKRP